MYGASGVFVLVWGSIEVLVVERDYFGLEMVWALLDMGWKWRVSRWAVERFLGRVGLMVVYVSAISTYAQLCGLQRSKYS